MKTRAGESGMSRGSSSALRQSRKALRYLLVSATMVYGFVLCFPQVLFAYEVSHDDFKVYSREPLDPNIHAILDDVEGKLSASGIHDKDLRPRIFLFDSHRHYAWLSLYVGSNSFAKSYPALPTDNIFVNKSDVARDLVFRDAEMSRSRSLRGVLAHEVTHLLVREKFGYFTNLTLPAWKQEGYSEYVAGGTLLDHETGVRMWREHPTDDTGYRYFKYYMLVSYLLDRKKLSVEEMFIRDFDRPTLEGEVLDSL
jgi:hypothetical protein